MLTGVILLFFKLTDAVRFRFASVSWLLAVFLYASNWNAAYAIVTHLDRRFYMSLLVV